MKPLISVVVPVYKVEAYLIRCLDSLRRQSLVNIEIILINDASPDRCGAICDEYAAKDKRFKVFYHAENMGLSIARNTGIQLAIADYLMFVDSDDWVHEDFCKEAYECVVRYGADIVIFKYQRIKKSEHSKKINNYINNFIPSGLIPRDKAIELLIKGVLDNAAWNKLYRKELFHDITYPRGYLCEDIGTTYKILLKANRIYFLNKVLYNYFYREDSITAQNSSKLWHDWCTMSIQQYHDFVVCGYSQDKLDEMLQNIAMFYCIKAKPDKFDLNYVFCANVLHNCKIIPNNFTCKRKILLILFKYFKWLFDFTCALYGKKVR